MPPDRRGVEQDPCPVSDHVLGELYRSNPHGLGELVATIPPTARAMLALYCYRRAHLTSIGLAIAASCDEGELTRAGGNAGAVLFAKSRESPQAPSATSHYGRRKITLASGPLRQMGPIEDETDE
jgi:hypothetical protein